MKKKPVKVKGWLRIVNKEIIDVHIPIANRSVSVPDGNAYSLDCIISYEA